MPLWLSIVLAFAPPTPWALSFSPPPWVPAVGDLNQDGYADLIAVNPEGEGAVNVSLSVQGMKAGRPYQALAGWGKGCRAAVGGEFDGKAGGDVLGLCGNELRLAGGFENDKLKALGVVAQLPKSIGDPVLIFVGGEILVLDRRSKRGYRVTPGTWEIKPSVPSAATLPYPGKDGSKIDGATLPSEGSVFAEGDADHDGDLDAFEFRYGKEPHVAYQVLLHRKLSAGENDSDCDGLSNENEAKLGTDPVKPDTDGDGLLDGWEVAPFRGLDLPGLGCSPLRTDIVCLVSRFDDVDEAVLKSGLDRVKKVYADLPLPNVDHSTGWGFHVVMRDPISGDDRKHGWAQNRDQFLPAEWRGVVHWMQVSKGGGGQADQLGDGGSCGVSSLWAVFLHEFGHQLGLDHSGFWGSGLCPIYPSLMNYAYSYSLDGDANLVAYSKGDLAGYTLKESDLDETIPLPYEKIKFLEKPPYRYRLKPNGKTTLIDWNWNGVFGEKHIRADINYSYSTNAGARDTVDKTMTAPWLFVHRDNAYVLYGKAGDPPPPGAGPSPAKPYNGNTVTPENPGRLVVRRLISPRNWAKEAIVDEQLLGDPVALSAGGKIVFVYARPEGIVLRRGVPGEDFDPIKIGGGGAPRIVGKPSANPPLGFDVLDPDPTKVPTIGKVGNRSYIFLWDPKSHEVSYRSFVEGNKPGEVRRLFERSTVPVGMAVDTVTHEVLIAMAQDQDDKRLSRWQVRRFEEQDGLLRELSMEWVDGEAGNVRGRDRVRVLFKQDRDTGPSGRIYIYGKALHGDQSPWACTYVAESIADKDVHGGWITKRFYDEWTQSRSAPAATWYDGDIIWAYRWVDGSGPERDNVLHVGYHALGIDPDPMGDFDDLHFMSGFGIRNSILYLFK